MSADASGIGEQEESPFKHEEKIPETQEEQNGENPFDQEEVIASTPAQEGGAAGYMPEDAVIEYGYESGEDFYDPSKNKEGEEDSVFMTEEAGDSPARQSPPVVNQFEETMPIENDISPGAGSGEPEQDENYGSQLDKMFPDDGFKQEGKLSWDGKEKEADDIQLTESYPSMPGEGQQIDPSAMTAEMEGEGVPDSPSGYVVITPSGRKKGVSPEIAQLLERTSKRQDAIKQVGFEVQSPGKHKAVLFILIVLFLAASSVAGYMYNQSKKTRNDLAKSQSDAQKLRGDLQAKFNTELKKAQDIKEEIEGKLEQTDTAFTAYKKDVEDKVSQFETLKGDKEQLTRVIDDLKEKNREIPELETVIEKKDQAIGELNSTVQFLRKTEQDLKAGVHERESASTNLRNTIDAKITEIAKLKEGIEELKSIHKGPLISPSKVASLRDSVREKSIKIEALQKHIKDLKEQLDRIQAGVGGQAEINKLIMKLVIKNEEIINLQEQIAKLQYGLRRFSSPESTIGEWAKAYVSGELGRVIKHYANDNYHRKRWEAGGEQQKKLVREFEEFTAQKIEPEVISITINPQDSTAAAKLKLKLTGKNGKSRIVNATMLLLREYEHWVILDEGF